ncbi:MAG: hypothetical protein ACRDRH_09505 [Pseudonocardia sp.]
MTSAENGASGPVAGAVPPPQVRWAGALVGVEALLGLGFTIALVVRAFSSDLPVTAVVGQASFFALAGAALVAVAGGLVAGRRWARSPAIVTQLLLLPVVYSLLGSSQQLVLGIVTGALVISCFMLLISERSRIWSMGLDLPDSR